MIRILVLASAVCFLSRGAAQAAQESIPAPQPSQDLTLLRGAPEPPAPAVDTLDPEKALEDLRKLRRERRKKEAELKTLEPKKKRCCGDTFWKVSGGEGKPDEARKRREALVADIEGLRETTALLTPNLIQELLKELREAPPEAHSHVIARLAEVGTPAIPSLETLMASGTEVERKRARDALKLIREVESADDGLWRQWAVGAKASSEYQGQNKGEWSAAQACGKPDTMTVGDLPTAWATQEMDGGKEWLEVTYRIPVRPARVRILESFNPGAVVKVECLDVENRWHSLWEGKGVRAAGENALEIACDSPCSATRVVRVTLDTASVQGWNEIDAVQLLGEPPDAMTAAPRPSAKDTSALPPKMELVRAHAIQVAVQELLKMQDESGRWQYELPGEGGKIKGNTLAIEVAGTSIVSQALMFAAPEDAAVRAAVKRGLDFVLKALEHPHLGAITEPRYDLRIWGQCFALDFLCHVRSRNLAVDRARAVELGIRGLVGTIAREERRGGGWDYWYEGSAPFVTAPVIQSLMHARSQGVPVPGGLFERARKSLLAARSENGAFSYASSPKAQAREQTHLQESAGRSLLCESTLRLLGGSSNGALQQALDNFHAYWNVLAVRSKRRGTHAKPYGVAPYYFYFAHRYAAQTIEMLPEDRRGPERERLLETILKTRDEDGTWNDRHFSRARSVGTAFVLLALLFDRAPRPPTMGE